MDDNDREEFEKLVPSLVEVAELLTRREQLIKQLMELEREDELIN